MKSRNAFVFAIAMVLLRAMAFAQAPADSLAPPDTVIRKILADRIGAENLGIGIVVGVIDPKGRRVIAYGSLAKDDKRSLNGDIRKYIAHLCSQVVDVPVRIAAG